MALDAQFVQNFNELPVERLVASDGIREWHVDHLVVTDANHDIALSLA